MRAQVSGVVQTLSPGLEPGSFVTEGQTLVRLEQADYQAALIQQQAALQQAKAELEIEQGNQAVARSEFALLGGDVSPADRKRMLRGRNCRWPVRKSSRQKQRWQRRS
ncbi:MAG: hypothetical protein R3F38_12655 [Gammaproteobacteria bacterium]